MTVNNKEMIDAVLKDLFYSVKNDNINLNGKMVYDYLIQMNVNLNERDLDLGGRRLKQLYNDNGYGDTIASDNLFCKWINRFKSKKNISVFWDPNWSHFCRFENGNVPSKCVKMYIPLDYNHIYGGANRIFDFLEKNDIQHHSKISSIIRFDDIVVRLGNKEDAQRLQNFIDGDSYIREGLIKCNPFAFSCNGISYAFDNYSSYNRCVAHLISSYINFMVRVRNAAVKNVNVRSFYSFIDLCSKDSSLMNEMLSKYSGSYYDISADDLYIVSLLKKSIESNNIDDFYKFTDFAFNDKIYNKISSEMDEGKSVNFEEIYNNNEFEKENKKELFDELILTTMKKYKTEGYAYLNNFLEGNIYGVTRTNNLRNRVANNLSSYDVENIVLNSQLPGYSYADKLNNYIEVVMLNDMIKCSDIKFSGKGLDQVDEYICSNNKSYITNSVGEARQLSYTLNPFKIESLFKKLGVRNIYDYSSYYYNSVNLLQKTRTL